MKRILRKLISLSAAALLTMCAYAQQGNDQGFKCPAGTRDSGGKPGAVVRWCEVEKDGRLLYHGPLWRWHRNGQLESKEQYVYGDAEGEWPSWHENGKRSSLGSFREGEKVGLWKYWNEAGSLETEVTYGRVEHQRTDYYASGAKKSAGPFAAGGKVGEWTYWSEDGQVLAQCDFGSGLLALPSEGCELIARELEPQGHSLPIPKAIKIENGIIVSAADQSFRLTTPAGWVADLESGSGEQLPVVFYPTGSAWKSPGPNMYVRVMFKQGITLQQIVDAEQQGFEENVAEYREEIIEATQSRVLKKLSYRPVSATDSPFGVVAPNEFHEAMAFLDVSPEMLLLVVLTADTEAQRGAALPGFLQVLDSIARQ